MIFRPFTLLCLVAFLGAGLHVYQTKHESAVLDRELRSIARKVEEADARTQTLQAEWAWLNEPERLRSVTQRHLPALEAMQPTQFVRASEAERRLPTSVAYDGPTALFAPREPATPEGNTSFALLPRIAAPVQVAVVAPLPASAPTAPVLAAPVIAPDPLPAAPVPAPASVPAAAPVPSPAAPPPAIRLALPPALPRVAEPPAMVAARPAEPRATESRPADSPPRPALADLARVTASRPAPPRPVVAPRPAPSEVASLPPVAAPSRPSITQVANAAPARAAVEPPRSFAPPGFASSSVLGGGSRPLLPPPVPFGSAGAATLGAGAAAR